MRVRLLTLLAVLVSFALIASSCGDDDGDEAASGATGCDGVDLSSPPDEPVNIRFGHGAGK